MHIHKWPAALLKDLNTAIKDFIWNGAIDKKKRSWLQFLGLLVVLLWKVEVWTLNIYLLLMNLRFINLLRNSWTRIHLFINYQKLVIFTFLEGIIITMWLLLFGLLWNILIFIFWGKVVGFLVQILTLIFGMLNWFGVPIMNYFLLGSWSSNSVVFKWQLLHLFSCDFLD